MNKLSTLVISIDGGAASGKSSTSRGLAARFNLMHVDTGSHYRAVTFALLAAGIAASDKEAIRSQLEQLRLDEAIDGQNARIRIDEQLPQEKDIRSEAVNKAVSPFAAVPEVRQFLFAYQRSQAEVAARHGFSGLIMEGRDIGSVIFPDAALRFYLEADEATRTQRRAKEGLTDAVAERDRIDSTRKTAPLVCPEGAMRIDTSPLTLEEVIDKLAAIITEKTGLAPRNE